MRVELSNGRQFIVKLGYRDIPYSKHSKDEYGRDVYIEWTEKETLVKIQEWFKTPGTTTVAVIGKSHCVYKDTFDKVVGKAQAYVKALNEMHRLNIISDFELEELMEFQLNMPHFQAGMKN